MDLQKWLKETPKYTTFRVNILKKNHHESLQQYLLQLADVFATKQIPSFYFLKPDCLILERWSDSVTVDPTGKEVIVDALCAAAVLRGAHVFAPGVMGLPSSLHLDEKVDIYGDLEKKCKRGLKSLYDGKKKYVGTGYLKMLRSELFDNGIKPSGIAVHTLMPVSRLPVVNESVCPKGELLLQNLPSIVCGWVVNAQSKEYILDMCAAPGNKTTHLAEMSKNQACITALDKTLEKTERIRETCQIQGVTCVTAYAFDATKCHSEESLGIANGPPFPSNCFDKVLLDAPCSGLGQRPQLINMMSPKMIKSYKFLQRKLISEAIKLLKVGGKLVYSTCTITEDENEGLVSWVLEKFPCLKLIPAEPLLGGPGLPNLGLDDEQRKMVQRFGPHIDALRPADEIYRDSIGFFIAAFTKTANNK